MKYAEKRRLALDAALHAHLLPMLGSDDAVAFAVSQLAFTEAQLFEKQRIPMQYRQLVPISNAAGEWAQQIRLETIDHRGRGRRIDSRTKSIPKVDVEYGEQFMPVVLGGIGYDYTTEELRTSAHVGRPVSAAKVDAAFEGYERHMNDVALNGEANLPGLIDNPKVPVANAANGDWGNGTTTIAQMMADVNALILQIWEQTAYNEMLTDILLPPSALAYAVETPRSDGSDMTVLEWIKKNNIGKTERGIDINFSSVWSLETAGVGGTRRMMGYVKNPSRLVMHVPMGLRFLAPQYSSLLIEVPGEYKYSGVEFYRPKSAAYIDGI